jgi:hypothetical protein
MPFGHGRDKQPFFPAAFARVEIIAKALLIPACLRARVEIFKKLRPGRTRRGSESGGVVLRNRHGGNYLFCRFSRTREVCRKPSPGLRLARA